MLSSVANDDQIQAVAAEILRLDPDGSRTAQVLRDTFDQLYDGQRTGRYRVDQLHKTEKTHCGTLVEINLQRAFQFLDGTDMDYRIGGFDVDCKFSLKLNGWMIPPEARGHLCLLVWAEDSADPKWSMGIVRAVDQHLSGGDGNRDGKKALSKAGQNAIVWLFNHQPLPPNVLLQLDRSKVETILAQKSGQKKVNDIFRLALGMRVGRAVVATVAQQDDPMKRVRENGGARTLLKPEGIVILGQYDSHCAIARSLGVAVPSHGESVSVRLAPATIGDACKVEIEGKLWRVARDSDPVVTAPTLPKV